MRLSSIKSVYGMAAVVLMSAAGAIAGTPMPTFTGIGNNKFLPTAISDDGTVVAGEYDIQSKYEAYRWTAETGVLPISSLFTHGSAPRAVSPDGSAIYGVHTIEVLYNDLGNIQTYYPNRGFYWNAETGVQTISNPLAHSSCGINCVTGDGQTFYGVFSPETLDVYIAGRWTPQSGWTSVPDLTRQENGDYLYSVAYCSSDGSVLTGIWVNSTLSSIRWCRWTEADGPTFFENTPSGDNFSIVNDISNDGTTIVGRSNQGYPIRWKLSEGTSVLRNPSGQLASGQATSVTADGSVVVGEFGSGNQSRAYIWDATNQTRDLQTLLSGMGVPNVGAWRSLRIRTLITPDGRFVTGLGRNDNDSSNSYLIDFGAPEEPTCPADFNQDDVRDVADLFAYINAWLAKTSDADFNTDTTVDVADLFAYINAWLAGC